MIRRRSNFRLFFFAVALGLALAAALLPLADGHVAQAQPTRVQMVYSLFEVDPLEFEEDVGTVRVGILAETNETGAPTSDYGATLSSKFGTAGSEIECVPPDDYRAISDKLQFRSADFEAFTNDDGETRYRQSLYRDVWIFDDRVLEETESFRIVLERFSPYDHYPLFDVDELELTINDNDGFVGVAFDSTAITVTEGTASTYRLALGSLPSGNVTVAIVDPPNAEVTADPEAVTFTPTDWYVPQTVTVAADHDADATDETIMTIAHLVSSVDDSNFDGVIADSVTVTVRDDDGGKNTSKTSLDHDTAAVRGANGRGLISEGAAALKIDFALVAPEPVREDAGTVRIEVVAATYSPGEPSDREIYVYPINNTAEWGRDYKFGGWTDDEYYVAEEQVEFLSGDFEPFVDIEGDTRYRAVKYFDIDIINDSLTEDAESFELIFSDNRGDFYLADRECVSVYEIEVTIIDDDPPVQMEYSLVEAGPFEEDAGTVQVEVVAVTNEAGVPNTEYAVGVQSEDVTANSPGDYAEVDETLDFPLGDFAAFVNDVGDTRYRQTVSFDVVIVDNRFDEGTETFRLKLSESPGYEGSVFGVPEIEVTINDNDTAGVTVTPTELKIEEGNSDTYDVVLDTRPSSDVTVTINDPANPEITAEPASWTFTPNDWDELRTVTVTADHDSDRIDEAAATITHTVTSTFDQYDDLSADSVTVTVTDDDVLSVAVSFEHSSYEVAESDDAFTMDEQENEATVKVTLSDDPERTVDIPLILTNQGGASAADYSGVPTSVTFNSGEMSQSFTFTAADDGVDDDGESVKLTFGTPPEGVNAGSVPETIVTITDDDLPASVTVSFSSPTYPVTEGGGVEVTVNLSEDPERKIVIPISRENLGGATDSDYRGVPPSVTFNSGEMSESFTVEAVADNLEDIGESVKLGFDGTLPDGVSAGSTSEATVTIADGIAQNSLAVSFEFSEYTLPEGATTMVTVTLNAAPGSEVTIPLVPTAEGETSNSDYSGVPASVIFDSGDIEKNFPFTAEADDVDDDGESVKLTFGTLPAGVSAGSISVAIVNITDDDTAGVNISETSLKIEEGDSDTYDVALDTEPTGDVTVTIEGATDTDLTLDKASLTFTFDDWSAAQRVTVKAEEDDDATGDAETLSHAVSVGSAAEYIGVAISDVAVTITDNDAVVTIAADAVSVTEGAPAAFTLTRAGNTDTALTVVVSVTEEGEYISGAAPTSASFEANDVTTSLIVATVDDGADEANGSVTAALQAGTGYVVGTDDAGTVTITDDDVPASVAASFSAPTYPVTEGGGVEVTVNLSEDPEREIVIPISRTNQGGATDSDYRGVPPSVTFNSGEMSESFTVEAVADNLEDVGESVKLWFDGTLPDGVSAGSTSEATVTIADGIAQNSLAVSFEFSEYTLPEGATTMVTVTLNAAPGSEVTIPLVPTGEGETSDADYSGVPASVIFNATDISKSFPFTAEADDVDDDGESLKLTFGTLPAGVSAGSITQAIVTITDDETVMEVSFGKSNYTVDEGHEVEVMVRLYPAPDHKMNIQIQKTNMNGASDGDYNGVPSMLTFEADETESTFTFFAETDDEYDDRETVELSFVALPAMVRKGDPSKAMVTLRDNSGSSKDGITCINNNRANIVTVLSGRGVISSSGGIDTWVIPGVDPYRTYLVEILGADSSVDVWGQDVGGGLTLADPHPVSLYHEDKRIGGHGYNSAPGDFGTGRNSRFIFIFNTFGNFVLKIKSGESADDQGTGSYRLLVRYDNYCRVTDDGRIIFPFEGGPEGYAFDIRNDIDTRFEENEQKSPYIDGRPYFAGGHFLGDNWGSEPDEDWIRFKDLEGNTEYEVSLEGAAQYPEEHRLMMPRITGIFDKNGMRVHEGEAGSGTDPFVRLTFQTASSGGDYYLGVGSNLDDGTGVYSYHVMQTESNNARRAANNNSPTGGPGIKGLPRIGEELTATTSGIADADGLTNVSYSYQWVVTDGGTDADISGETDASYTLVADDVGKTIKVKVSFKDDADNDETLTSAATEAVAARPNTSATGRPTISGTVRVSETLTADISGIADDDGLTNVSYSYQWVVTDGGTDADISGERDASYTLVADDVGKTIKVRVTFKDDADNDETLTSAATDEVSFAVQQQQASNTPATGGPTIGGRAEVGETLTADTSGIADADGLVNATYRYQWVANDGGTDTDISGERDASYTLVAADEGKTIKVRVIVTDDAENETTLTSAATDEVSFAVQQQQASNSPATGGPTIGGRAEVGETLTADTSGIADADGLSNVSYNYQWVANDGGTDADISGETDASYTLVADDVGKTIQVRVSFTDDADNQERLTSAATEAVAARPNTSATGLPTIGGTARVGEVLTADTTGIADVDGLSNVSYGYQWVAGGTDLGGATASAYTLTAGERGKTIKVRVSFTDDADNQERLTSAATEAVAARPNTSATGLPTIRGTVRVGEVLTADTTGIGDADGLTNVSYSYQWVVTDGGAYLDISGETGATYTLVAIDRGLYIQVRVSFTDDAGNREKLTSAVTEAVAAAP